MKGSKWHWNDNSEFVSGISYRIGLAHKTRFKKLSKSGQRPCVLFKGDAKGINVLEGERKSKYKAGVVCKKKLQPNLNKQ